MSGDPAPDLPPDDIVASLGGKAEGILRDALDRMERALENEGLKTFRFPCEVCGKGNTQTARVVDAEQLRKYADTVASITFRAAAVKKDLGVSEAATQLLRDTEALSQAELADHIESLERDIAADNERRAQALQAAQSKSPSEVNAELAAAIEGLSHAERAELLVTARS